MSWHATEPRLRRRSGARGLALGCGLLALLVVGAIGATFLYGRSQLDAARPDHTQKATIVVKSGESVDSVINDLDAHHLLKSRWWFSWYVRFKGLDSVAAGRYNLDSGMGSSAIVARLQQVPDVTTTRVVLAEGLTAQQMARKVQAANVGITADQYMAEVQHGAFTAPFLARRSPGATLEGFLFPDTYDVAQGTNAHDFVQMQLDDYAQKALPILSHLTGSLNDYQALTLASIVEREARFAEDRPLVAAVLVNRLVKGMDLQVDASVTYGLGRASGEPSPDDLQRDTPYNTYLHPGLPPTPISNPGAQSLQAAASPASVPYLFYVSDGCGHNHYSTTAAEHDRNVQQYLGKPCAGG